MPQERGRRLRRAGFEVCRCNPTATYWGGRDTAGRPKSCGSQRSPAPRRQLSSHFRINRKLTQPDAAATSHCVRARESRIPLRRASQRLCHTVTPPEPGPNGSPSTELGLASDHNSPTRRSVRGPVLQRGKRDLGAKKGCFLGNPLALRQDRPRFCDQVQRSSRGLGSRGLAHIPKTARSQARVVAQPVSPRAS